MAKMYRVVDVADWNDCPLSNWHTDKQKAIEEAVFALENTVWAWDMFFEVAEIDPNSAEDCYEEFREYWAKTIEEEEAELAIVEEFIVID